MHLKITALPVIFFLTFSRISLASFFFFSRAALASFFFLSSVILSKSSSGSGFDIKVLLLGKRGKENLQGLFPFLHELVCLCTLTSFTNLFTSSLLVSNEQEIHLSIKSGTFESENSPFSSWYFFASVCFNQKTPCRCGRPRT